MAATAACMLIGSACGPDAPVEPSAPDDTFTASLHADNMVGIDTESGATGTATFHWNGTRLTFSVEVQNMTEVIAGHVHGPATTDETASIILNLFLPSQPTGTVNGELASGAAVAGSHLLVGVPLDSVISLMRAGRAFVMLHTRTYPGGEIRGQLVRQ